MMKSNFITVLNHIDGQVYQHTLPPSLEKTGAGSYIQLENWLMRQGYSLGNIEWMVHKYPVVLDGDRDCEECECGENRDPNLCGSGCYKNTN